MTPTREQKKGAYKKLAPKVQDFVMDNETTEIIDNFLKEAGLSEEQNVEADTQILYAMYGLQSLSGAIEEIAKVCGKNRKDFAVLEKKLQENIFDKITEIQSEDNSEAHQNETVQSKPSNNVGNSFEQIILNQARAMQPAREASAQSAPDNLPTGNEPIKIHDYPAGNDPYREPIE